MRARINLFRVFSLVSLMLLSSCSLNSRQVYSDNYPEPCTPKWFVAIEDELKLVDSKSNLPPPGSIQWLKAADEKLSISAEYGHPPGDIEWCHQLHQALIGL